MSEISSVRLADLWTRHLAGEALSSDERTTLADAFTADEVFRRRVLFDQRLDGALRVEADLRRNQGRMLKTMRDLLRAAVRSEGFIRRLRPRLETAAIHARASGSELARQRRASVRRTVVAGLTLAAGLAAAFVFGFRPDPRRSSGSRDLARNAAAKSFGPAGASTSGGPGPEVAGITARRPTPAISERVGLVGERRRAALLVGGDDPRELEPAEQASGDETLRAHLEQMGFEVQVLAADSLVLDELKQAQVVVLSPSVLALALSDELVELPIAMVALESSAYARLGLTGPRWKRDLGMTPVTMTDLVITNPDQVLAAGLSGQLSVVSRRQRMRWGVPGPEAISIASFPGAPINESLFFAYERGARTPGGIAAARRVAIFLGNASIIRRLTAPGWQLFDAAVKWSADDER